MSTTSKHPKKRVLKGTVPPKKTTLAAVREQARADAARFKAPHSASDAPAANDPA